MDFTIAIDFLRETTFAGNSLLSWLIAVVLAFISFTVIRSAVALIRVRLAKITAKTKVRWDDVIVNALGRTKSFVVLVVAMYIGSASLTFAAGTRNTITAVATVVVLIQVGLWATAVITTIISGYAEERRDDGATVTTMNAVTFLVKVLVWAVVLLLAIDNMGVDVTALVAGLGVAGIAVALALQNILGDLFASLTIVLDKPFVYGDFIIVGDLPGSVEHVGLKTTRVRALSGEQLVFSNGDLLSSRIRNFGRMRERRVLFTIGVTYSTPREKLEKIPAIVREAIEEQERTRFDRSHFKAYGDFSLIFETVYFMLVPDYNAYMDVQQAVNFAIHRAFEDEGIAFAFPTQTIHLVTAGTEDTAGT